MVCAPVQGPFLKDGSPFHGSAAKILWNPPATSGQPGLPVQRSANATMSTVAPTQQIANKASRVSERPGHAHSPQRSNPFPARKASASAVATLHRAGARKKEKPGSMIK